MAGEAGTERTQHILPTKISQQDRLALAACLDADAAVAGVVVRLPLSGGPDSLTLVMAADPAADYDGLRPGNADDTESDLTTLVSSMPLACLILLRGSPGSNLELGTVTAGRSALADKPTADLLPTGNRTVTIAHAGRQTPVARVERSDLGLAAAGPAKMIRDELGATVPANLAVRTARDSATRLLGDDDGATANPRSVTIAPVRGDVEPTRIMALMHDTLRAAFRRADLPFQRLDRNPCLP